MGWRHASVGVVLLAACTDAPNDPEVRVGAGDLQFIRTMCDPAAPACAPTILADYDLTNPYYNWSVYGDQLETVALANGSASHPNETRIDLIPLDETPLIQMRYRSNPPFDEQDEVVLFARDPEEFYQKLWEALFLAPSVPSQWLNQITVHALPQAVSMSYPPFAVTLDPNSFSTVSLPTSAFWGTQAPGLPGSAPDGSGSIKAARVVQHGRCSAEEPFSPISGDGLLQQFNSSFTTALGTAFSGSTVRRNYSAAIPFLHQTETREDSQWGGFFFTGAFDAFTTGFGVSLSFAVPYVFRLLDGIGTIDSLGANALVTTGDTGDFGPSADQIHWTIDELLDTPFESASVEYMPKPSNIEQAMYQAFDTKQATTSNPASNALSLKCTLREVGLTLTRTLSDTHSQCASLISVLDGWVTNPTHFGLVNPPLTADESQVIFHTLNETIPDPYNPDQTVLKNFRCNPVFPDGTAVDTADPSHGVCEVVVRAKRINSYPDALELVFFDDEHEVDAEAYGLFLFLGGDAGSGAGNNALCTRTPVAGAGLHARRYGISFLGASP